MRFLPRFHPYTVLRKLKQFTITQITYAKLEPKHWKYLSKFRVGRELYTDRISVTSLQQLWPEFRALVMSLWRSEYTRGIRATLRGTFNLPAEPGDWTAAIKCKIIEKMIEIDEWQIKVIKRLNYMRNAYLDGPLRMGDYAWALTQFNCAVPSLVFGKVSLVKCTVILLCVY